MFSIERLRELIAGLEATERRYTALLRERPDSFAARSTVKNAQQRLEELRAELALQQRLREREVVELRLVGPLAQQGRLPLAAFGGLLNALDTTLHEASHFVEYGSRRGAARTSLVKQLLGLRFEQVLPGSSRIFLTGNTAPNLFGESVLANGLDRTFTLLDAPTNPAMEDAAARVGTRTVAGAKRLADVSLRYGMGFDLRWQPPAGETRLWSGDAPRLAFLTSRLGRLAEQTPEREAFQGEIIAQSMRGWLDIKQGRRLHRVTFPLALLEAVRAVPIGSACEGVWLKTTLRNEVTQEPRYQYELESVRRAQV